MYIWRVAPPTLRWSSARSSAPCCAISVRSVAASPSIRMSGRLSSRFPVPLDLASWPACPWLRRARSRWRARSHAPAPARLRPAQEPRAIPFALVDSYSLAPVREREESEPPFKPCWRISRTRLTGSVSGSCITRSARTASQGTEWTHAGGLDLDVRSTRASNRRPHPVADVDPCAQGATTKAAAGRSHRFG
jgi:hypothetical protein